MNTITVNVPDGYEVQHFYADMEEYIEKILDLTDNTDLAGGEILWEKPKEVIITMDEIAKKFGYPVESIKIKK